MIGFVFLKGDDYNVKKELICRGRKREERKWRREIDVVVVV